MNQVLIGLRDSNDLSLSFDDREFAKYRITISQHFSSPEEAFTFLLKDLPFSYEKSGEVYLFFPEKATASKITDYQISGKIYDAENTESLAFAHILINGIGGITDEYGNFNYQSNTDSIFTLKISHLGYQLLDTLINTGTNHCIGLSSAIINMQEFVVKANTLYFLNQTGSQAGLMRINHKIARFIPGNGDNSIFNILRLQPGILAAGEQSSEMIIWGSYAGQSQINFDGITLFGLKNYNDNISTVNPYMAKDIRIHKGGFDATMGERVGGIVDITGIDGNKTKPGLNFNLNNMTMNVLAETPIGKRITIVGAYRQTYYNLYNSEDFKFSSNSENHLNENTILANPDYLFQDGNLKISGSVNNGDTYQLSSFWGQDHFSYAIDQIHSNMNITQELIESNLRYGANFHYNKIWKGKGSSKISIAYSSLESFKYDTQNSSQMNMNHIMDHDMHSKELETKNNIDELKSQITGNYQIFTKHIVNTGVGFIKNSTFLNENSAEINVINQNDNGSQIMAFVQDRFSPNTKTNFTFGLRSDYSIELQKLFLQPRFNITYKPIQNFQLNASWGIYNQFVALSSVVDEYNNYRFLWKVSDGNKYPVLWSQHFVLGGVAKQNGFIFSIESFYKETEGITRVVESSFQNDLFEGKSKAKGIDLFIKKEFKGHSAWISYSLSQTLEWFPFFSSNNYENAIHDQRHEIKLASVIKLRSFYISTNYVVGSGFSLPVNSNNDVNTFPYKRLDVAGIYQFSSKKIKFEIGLSVLNLFNYENIKFSNITQIPTDDIATINVYTEAIPFTPTIFLNILF